ncbi:hypothetical protein FACS1894172_20560 [Spirochaetia bacterium]|nr:hypothetical protein FACS1894164_09850 [Spirochaetia bacterium]GHU37209.1 hypothetical protein FACS1894172_20560 [Spirochaetia bacterium]
MRRVFLICMVAVAANGYADFAWSLGEIGFDVASNAAHIFNGNSDSTVAFNLSVVKFNFFDSKTGFGIGTSVFDMREYRDYVYVMSFLPVEVFWTPFVWGKNVFITAGIYARGGWYFGDDMIVKDGFYGAAGAKFSLASRAIGLTKSKESGHYYMSGSVFIEWTTAGKYRIGLTLDNAIWLLTTLLAWWH